MTRNRPIQFYRKYLYRLVLIRSYCRYVTNFPA